MDKQPKKSHDKHRIFNVKSLLLTGLLSMSLTAIQADDFNTFDQGSEASGTSNVGLVAAAGGAAGLGALALAGGKDPKTPHCDPATDPNHCQPGGPGDEGVVNHAGQVKAVYNEETGTVYLFHGHFYRELSINSATGQMKAGPKMPTYKLFKEFNTGKNNFNFVIDSIANSYGSSAFSWTSDNKHIIPSERAFYVFTNDPTKSWNAGNPRPIFEHAWTDKAPMPAPFSGGEWEHHDSMGLVLPIFSSGLSSIFLGKTTEEVSRVSRLYFFDPRSITFSWNPKVVTAQFCESFEDEPDGTHHCTKPVKTSTVVWNPVIINYVNANTPGQIHGGEWQDKIDKGLDPTGQLQETLPVTTYFGRFLEPSCDDKVGSDTPCSVLTMAFSTMKKTDKYTSAPDKAYLFYAAAADGDEDQYAIYDFNTKEIKKGKASDLLGENVKTLKDLFVDIPASALDAGKPEPIAEHSSFSLGDDGITVKAADDQNEARITVVNQTPMDRDEIGFELHKEGDAKVYDLRTGQIPAFSTVTYDLHQDAEDASIQSFKGYHFSNLPSVAESFFNIQVNSFDSKFTEDQKKTVTQELVHIKDMLDEKGEAVTDSLIKASVKPLDAYTDLDALRTNVPDPIVFELGATGADAKVSVKKENKTFHITIPADHLSNKDHVLDQDLIDGISQWVEKHQNQVKPGDIKAIRDVTAQLIK